MPERKQDDAEHESSPPGEFISDDLRAHTARFLEELRKRLSTTKPEEGPKLGPPTPRK